MNSEWVTLHHECEKCGSSDAASTNSEGWTTCFSCGERWRSEMPTKNGYHESKPVEFITTGVYQDLKRRKIRQETCRKFSYQVDTSSGVISHIANYHNFDGEVVAQKIRYEGKKFRTIGNFQNAVLFGQKLWGDGGKRLVITEGELDALSYAQVTDLSWPVVSLPAGSAAAVPAIKKNIEWVSTFQDIVLFFDQDEPGRKAAQEVSALFSPGQCRIVKSLPDGCKDASDLLMKGEEKQLSLVIFSAQVQRPDGIINAFDLWDQLVKQKSISYSYPWELLTAKLYGLRLREIVTLCAGSGVGKSLLAAEIAHYLVQEHKQTVGYLAFEENVVRTAKRFLGFKIGLPPYEVDKLDPESIKEPFDELFGDRRYVLHDGFGSFDMETILLRMHAMVKAENCQWLVFDHVSMVVSGLGENGNERRILDKTMTDLRSFVEKTNIGLILVSHLKRPDGKGHENGAETSLAQLRGSAGIAQLSDVVIGAERDLQAEDENRLIMQLRILKNRYAGITGLADTLRYNEVTGRLEKYGIE